MVLANKEEKNFSYSRKVAVRSEDVAMHGGQVARQVGVCVLQVEFARGVVEAVKVDVESFSSLSNKRSTGLSHLRPLKGLQKNHH